MAENDKNEHYYILMHPLNSLEAQGVCITYTTSSSPEKWVECEIIVSDDGEVVTLCPVEVGYGSVSFPVATFNAHLMSGCIVSKDDFLALSEENQSYRACCSLFPIHVHALKKQDK